MSVFSYAKLGSCLFATAMLLPGAILANSCAPHPPTSQSYTWNFQREARGLLSDVHSEAMQTSFHADKLRHFSPEITWEEDAFQLNAIRQDVNRMGTRLCRLETIERVTAPWEQKAINEAAPLITEMANETQSAIKFLNHNHDYLFNPAYHAYSAEIYRQSTKLDREVNQLERTGETSRHLEESTGLIKKS